MTRIAPLLCLICLLAGQALAQSPQDRLVKALQADGYVILQSERTWLGRLRIVAVKGDLRREVVINPGTGEVLRDIASVDEAVEGSKGELPEGTATASSGAGPDVAKADGTTSALSTAPAEEGAATLGATGVERDVLLPEAGVTQ